MTERTGWNRRTKPLPEPHLARLQRRMAKGQSLEEAAEGVGLTLSLAKSVFIRSGLPVPKPYRHRSTDAARERQALGRRVHEYLKVVDSAPAGEVAKALGVTLAQVRAAAWDQDQERLLRRPTARQKYSDTAILIGLKLMSIERGRATYARAMVPVSAAYWNEHRDPAAHPMASDVVGRFGSWSEACRRAGVPTRPSKPFHERRRWTDEQLVAALREFFASGVGSNPAAYEAWVRAHPDAPGLATLRTRFGSWTEVRARSEA